MTLGVPFVIHVLARMWHGSLRKLS